MNTQSTETIVACSSGEVSCAISLIRISGSNYLKDINHFFDLELSKIKPRTAYFCRLLDKNQVIDEVVLTYFRGPHSYNGEDILEVSVHGNPLNVKRIIDLFCSAKNFRKSLPGEFSLRALENKKLTLNQIEGLDLLLNANSIFALDQGFSLLSGKLKEEFLALYENFLNHKSAIELGFDFLDDIGEDQFKHILNQSFINLNTSILSLYKRVADQGFSLIKPEISLVGQPNAGKSTLFNYLLSDDRAIVSDIAGTTRDYLSEDIFINNNKFRLVDTAGIRNSSDTIEELGIKKALEIIKNSFFKILLIDPRSYDPKYFEQLHSTKFDLILFTHRDRSHFKNYLNQAVKDVSNSIGPIEPIQNFGPIEPSFDFGPIEPHSDTGPIEPVLCANLNSKSSDLRDFIYSQINLKYQKLLDFDPILIERHADSIKIIYEKFATYSQVFENEDDLSIISSELNILGHCISELIGIVSPNDVLHNIFNNFCIGK